jgi:transposase
MDAIYIGIDVSKDRLDVAAYPKGEGFAIGRSGAGIDELIERLKAISPCLIAIEATGGFERIVAAGLAGAETASGGRQSGSGPLLR